MILVLRLSHILLLFQLIEKSHYIYLIFNYKWTLTRELTLGLCGGSFLHLCGGFSSCLKRTESNLTKHSDFCENFYFSFQKLFSSLYVAWFYFIYFFVIFFVTILLLSYFSVINVNLPKQCFSHEKNHNINQINE